MALVENFILVAPSYSHYKWVTTRPPGSAAAHRAARPHRPQASRATGQPHRASSPPPASRATGQPRAAGQPRRRPAARVATSAPGHPQGVALLYTAAPPAVRTPRV